MKPQAKRIFAVVLTVLMCAGLTLSLTACASVPYSSYDMSDYVEVGDYKGLKIGKIDPKVTDKEVDAHIKELQKAAATTKTVTTGKVEDGDNVNIDYVGKMNGKEFDGGSAEGFNLLIGSGTFIEGFESGIVGHEVGETFDLHLSFPDPYPGKPAYAGKPVTFTVTINSRKTTVIPELDKEFFESQGSDAEDLKAYRKEVKEDLLESEKESLEHAQKEDLWARVVKSSKIKEDEDGNKLYPEEEVTKLVEAQKKEFEGYAEQYGMDYETFVTSYSGQTVEEFEKDLTESVKQNMKSEMVLFYLVQQENISVSRKEYKEELQKYLDAFGMNEKEFKEATGSTIEEYLGGKEAIYKLLYQEKVEDMLLDNAKITDKPFKAE